MSYIGKITHNIDYFYRKIFVKEQYPMLTPISRKKLKKEGAVGVVYMLHHIADKDPNKIPTNEDLKISPSFLEKLIIKYKKQGFDFISLDTLYDILSLGYNFERPFIVFTLDDGYLDNYMNGLPVFEKNKVPFSIFVATDFIDKKAILWWDSLENLILTHDEIITSDGKRYLCRTFKQRWDTFRYLRERILNLNQSSLLEELNTMFSRYDISWSEPIKEKGMSWDQVSLLANHPLCTIGGHTVSHPALNKLDEDKFKMEVSLGVAKLEKETGKVIHHFAFPYGSANEIGERELCLIKQYNFKTVFMANGGCITKNNGSIVLPRVYLHEGFL